MSDKPISWLDDPESLREEIERLRADHIPLDAKLSVSCVLEMGQLPRDLLLAVNGEATDQSIDCRGLLGPYEREIERLRGALDGAQTAVRVSEKSLRVANNRIEELESRIAEFIHGETEGPKGIFIPRDKIRKAWEYIKSLNPDGARIHAEGALGTIGIVRCEGCGGTGKRGFMDDMAVVPHGDCNGEGFKIGGGDE